MQLTNLGLTLYLVGALKMGATGSALSTLSVHVLGQPLLLWPLGRRLAGVEPGAWLRETLRPGFLPAMSASVVWIGLEVLVRPDRWSSLAWCSAAGCLVYVAVLLGFSLQAYEQNGLRRLIQPVIARLTAVRCGD